MTDYNAILYVPPREFRTKMSDRKYGVKTRHKPDAVITRFYQLKQVIV